MTICESFQNLNINLPCESDTSFYFIEKREGTQLEITHVHKQRKGQTNSCIYKGNITHQKKKEKKKKR